MDVKIQRTKCQNPKFARNRIFFLKAMSNPSLQEIQILNFKLQISMFDIGMYLHTNFHKSIYLLDFKDCCWCGKPIHHIEEHCNLKCAKEKESLQQAHTVDSGKIQLFSTILTATNTSIFSCKIMVHILHYPTLGVVS